MLCAFRNTTWGRFRLGFKFGHHQISWWPWASLSKFSVSSQFLFVFWPLPQPVEVPGLGIKSAPQHQPEPPQGECQTLNPLHHKRTLQFQVSVLAFPICKKEIRTASWYWNVHIYVCAWYRYRCMFAHLFPSRLVLLLPFLPLFWNGICLHPSPVQTLLTFQSPAKVSPFLRSLLRSCKSISHGSLQPSPLHFF